MFESGVFVLVFNTHLWACGKGLVGCWKIVGKLLLHCGCLFELLDWRLVHVHSTGILFPEWLFEGLITRKFLSARFFFVLHVWNWWWMFELVEGHKWRIGQFWCKSAEVCASNMHSLSLELIVITGSSHLKLLSQTWDGSAWFFFVLWNWWWMITWESDYKKIIECLTLFCTVKNNWWWMFELVEIQEWRIGNFDVNLPKSASNLHQPALFVSRTHHEHCSSHLKLLTQTWDGW